MKTEMNSKSHTSSERNRWSHGNVLEGGEVNVQVTEKPTEKVAYRGLTLQECTALCQEPTKLPLRASKFQLRKHLRDEVLIRLLYETFARVSELLYAKMSDVDFEQCAIRITRPKGRAIFKIVDGKRVHVDTVYAHRWVFFGDRTRDLLIRYLECRKRGYLIITRRRKRMSSRQAERVVDYYAKKAGIQKIIAYTRNGRKIRLVTCKSLREAGERHTDVAGADRDATARIAGHTVRTKELHYKKGNFEEDRKIVRGHHPLMTDQE
jgi:integrase